MSQPKTYWVYIMANTKRGVMYVGITSALTQRVSQHKNGTFEGFTKRYGCKTLVWFEGYVEPHLAISREKKLKRWQREWKFTLIEAGNPEWRDLWWDLVGPDHVILTDEQLASLAAAEEAGADLGAGVSGDPG
jgi:putative endonuclease